MRYFLPSLFRETSNTEEPSLALHRSVFVDAERRKGTSSSQGQADKWQRFKRRNRRRARIFHQREKGGALAALSNCIPTFALKVKNGMVRVRVETARRHERWGRPKLEVSKLRETSYRISRAEYREDRKPNFLKKSYLYVHVWPLQCKVLRKKKKKTKTVQLRRIISSAINNERISPRWLENNRGNPFREYWSHAMTLTASIL